MGDDALTAADLEEIRALGIDPDEARRQLHLLQHPPPRLVLDRPCTPGDGIDSIAQEEIPRLASLHGKAARAGRFVKFVPASGAATRMFKVLLSALAADRIPVPRELGPDDPLRRFLDGLQRFAFHEELRRTLAARGLDADRLAREGPLEPLLRALLDDDGMGYARLPKGLLSFHTAAGTPRTPFEEHLAEAAMLFTDENGTCRLHFTISPEHEAKFKALLEALQRGSPAGRRIRYEVGFSVQAPATDTLALNDRGGPFRLSDGRILLRPSGHGALLRNLQELGADLVFIKNIDNVAAAAHREPTLTWTRAVAGSLVSLQEEIHSVLSALDEGGGATALLRAERLVRDRLHLEPASGARRGKTLRALLDRPVRVCGMVRTSGEPGGGPFWVVGRDGRRSLQIVEGAQVDHDDAGQRAVLSSATHFNPVFMACGVRDREGRLYDLNRFVDPDAVILTTKCGEGRPLRALERPGLWNGSMAFWNTLFVEVPGVIFNPAKTVVDLLRPGHQAG